MKNLKATNWYCRFPTIWKNNIYFVSGNEIFKVHKNSSSPELYYLGTKNFSNLCSYNDKIACVSTEDGGPDIYLLDIQTKILQRLTFFEKNIKIVKFANNNGEKIWFLSTKDSSFRQDYFLYEYCLITNIITDCNIGPINWMDFDENEQIFQKDGYGYTNWKRYKGGSVGKLWKNNKKLIDLKGNVLRPFLYKKRIYFQYDNGKCGNIYSCDNEGKDLIQHTFHENFQVQDLYICENLAVYTIAGVIGVYDIEKQKDSLLSLIGNIQHPENRPFISDAYKYLTCIDTDGNDIVSSIRGNVFFGGLYSGGIKQLNEDIRVIFSGFLIDKNTKEKKIFAFKELQELIIFDQNGSVLNKFVINTGKIHRLKTSGQFIAYSNHKNELHIIDTITGIDRMIIQAKYDIDSFDWLEQKYLAYCTANNSYQTLIAIYDLESQIHYNLTTEKHCDFCPTFDPEGKYIAFLSKRAANCFSDGIKSSLIFEDATNVYLIPLIKNYNPLTPWHNKTEEANDEKNEKIEIDFDDIVNRIIQLPISKKRYMQIIAIANSKIILVTQSTNKNDKKNNHIKVKTFCMKTLAEEEIYKDLTKFDMANNKEHCFIEDDETFKILKFNEKEEIGYKKNTAFNWNRIKITVDPKKEWRQMMQELCWLIKEFYWSVDASGVCLDTVFTKYSGYINNIRTRQEFEDLIEEIQGELATSHSFIFNTEEKKSEYAKGDLGIQFEYKNNRYYIKTIYDACLDKNIPNPILAANADIKTGDVVFAIDGTTLDIFNTPDKLLCAKENSWITLTVGNETKKKDVEIKTIANHKKLIYENWVKKNRNYVSKKTNNAVGYIHLQDMLYIGFKEFTQAYLNNYEKKSIIIDLRNNRGGNISYLLLDQLRRQKLGLDKTRWHGLQPIPSEAAEGNYILIINSNTASDAEIFAHQFKMLKMGKIIGERTWGGVIGIAPRYPLIDNTLTSQPEFGTWFKDIGYNLENHGVEPDIEIINDINSNFDKQLEIAIQEAIQLPSSNLEQELNNTEAKLNN